MRSIEPLIPHRQQEFIFRMANQINSLAVSEIRFRGKRCPKMACRRWSTLLSKNQPFELHIGMTFDSKFVSINEINGLSFQVKLVYDIQPLKEVTCVKEKPLEYRCRAGLNGESIVDIKIKVLSSQMEDSLFRLLVIPMVSSKCIWDHLAIISDPIKVVSKLEKDKGKKRKTMQIHEIPESKRKCFENVVFDSLERIESVCETQNLLLTRICSHDGEPLSPNVEKPNGTSEAIFNLAFQKFIHTYNQLEPGERSNRIRQLIDNLSISQNKVFLEMLRVFAQEAEHESSVENSPIPVENLEQFLSCGFGTLNELESVPLCEIP